MIEAAYAALGIDARYINCDVPPQRLGDAVRGALAMGWIGFNCSIPHKVAVIEHLDSLAPSAAIIGAVNCVAVRDGRLVGENTDGQGFLASLRTVTDPEGASVVLLGAGGAARAIAVELALAGARSIVILNRDRARGEELAALVNAKTTADAQWTPWNGGYHVPEATQLVINATSIGLYPDVDALPDIDLDSLKSDMVVADVIPNPPQTAFLRQAKSRSCITLDGLGMLVNQGCIGIELWTGLKPDSAVMTRKLEEIFRG